MKEIRKIFLCLILVLGLVVTSLPGNTKTSAATTDNPMRALWLRPKETTKAQVEAAVQKIKDAGINTIFLETVFDGYTIFPVTYDAIYQRPMFKGFDVLQAYIDACHSRGMQLHCWVESFFIGMEWVDAGGPVYKAHKDWLLEDKNGNNWEDTKYGKMYFFNPARPECRDWLVNLYAIFVKNYDIDGIQLDYVRYPEKTSEVDWGFDDYTINAFKKEKGFDPTNAKDGTWQAQSFVYFKQEQVTKFVQACSEKLKAIKPDLILSLSVYPFYQQGKNSFMQSAELWMDKGYGDLVVPMAYYEDQVESITNNTITVAGGSKMNAVIGISAQNGFTTSSMEKQANTVLNKGTGVAFFEYETFFSEGYASKLKTGALKNTEFNIDPEVYKSNADGNVADATRGYLTQANTYGFEDNYTKDICVFASKNSSDTVLTIMDQDEATFAYWYNFVLEYNSKKGTWVVTASDMTVDTTNKYQKEPLGENKMVVMFHEEVAKNQKESFDFFLKTAYVGKEYKLVGDFNKIISGSGELDGVYLVEADAQDSGSGSGSSSGSSSGSNSGSGSSSGSNSGSSSGSNSGVGTKPGAGSSVTPGTGTSTEPGDEMITEPGTELGTEVGTESTLQPDGTETVTDESDNTEKPSEEDDISEAKPDKETAPNTLGIALGVIAAMIAVGGVLFYFYMKKKKQTEKQ